MVVPKDTRQVPLTQLSFSPLMLHRLLLGRKKKDKKCRKLSFTRFCLKVTDFAAGTNISGFIAAQLLAEFG